MKRIIIESIAYLGILFLLVASDSIWWRVAFGCAIALFIIGSAVDQRLIYWQRMLIEEMEERR